MILIRILLPVLLLLLFLSERVLSQVTYSSNIYFIIKSEMTILSGTRNNLEWIFK